MAYKKIYFLVLIFLGLSININANLCPNFYAKTCPKAECIVKEVIEEAIKNETRVGASLLRLQFHDCFVNGCDGSILLDDTSTFTGEKTAIPNINSVRGFNVIDQIKAKLEQACPGVVSCADIIIIAARDSVVHYGGPSWQLQLGRRDSLTANKSAANAFIPAPFFNLSRIVKSFAVQNLSFKNTVALSGAHTIGFARCTNFRSRIYNDTDINTAFAKSLQSTCPRVGNNNTLQPLDLQTRFVFDSKYYQNLLVKKGLLHSDQELYNGNNKADMLVQKYATNQNKFFKDFVKGMIKMGNTPNTKTGSNGEVRLNCRKRN